MAIRASRFNAGIQRAKGLLELSSALYEGSLAERQVDATTGTVQTISPEAIERPKSAIPIDRDGELDMAQLCRNDDEAPRNVPLHPGAERFYREKGYLRD